MIGEFEFIQRFCTDLGVQHESVVLGVGDDGAIIDVPNDESLVVSTDTMNVNQHFYADADPYDLAHKLIHTNVSDIAAMGGRAQWATVALSLHEVDPDWLQRFSTGLNEQATALGVAIIGGDTTKGPLSMTLTILGTVKKGEGLLRSGAQPDDLICVSGVLGGAAAGLKVIQLLKNDTLHLNTESTLNAETWINHLDESSVAQLTSCLNQPKAQHTIGQSLAGYATSCIDISDGLAGDLHHILRASMVNATLEWSAIPVHPTLTKVAGLQLDQVQEMVLYGGEDYQLAFTISADNFTNWQHRFPDLVAQVSQVGRVGAKLSAQQSSDHVELTLSNHGQSSALSPYAYQHF